METIISAYKGTGMNCSENLYISMYEHQNILINEQNTCDYNSLYELRPSAEARTNLNRLCDKSAY